MVGHNVFVKEVQKRLAWRQFLALSTERRKNIQKKPHKVTSKLEIRKMVTLAKAYFKTTKSITYERYKLFTRTQKKPRELLELFHATLTADSVKEDLGTLKDELVRVLSISKMKNTVLEDILTFETQV